jgi:hypothetical protein
MPSDNKFEEEIKRAVEEKVKRVNESAKATEKRIRPTASSHSVIPPWTLLRLPFWPNQ